MITFITAPVTLYPSADSLFPQSDPTLTYVSGPTLARRKRPTKPKPQTDDVEPSAGGSEARQQRARKAARALYRDTLAASAMRVLRRDKSATVGRLASDLGVSRKMAGRAVMTLVSTGTVVKMRQDNFRRDHTTHVIYALATAATPWN